MNGNCACVRDAETRTPSGCEAARYHHGCIVSSLRHAPGSNVDEWVSQDWQQSKYAIVLCRSREGRVDFHVKQFALRTSRENGAHIARWPIRGAIQCQS